MIRIKRQLVRGSSLLTALAFTIATATPLLLSSSTYATEPTVPPEVPIVNEYEWTALAPLPPAPIATAAPLASVDVLPSACELMVSLRVLN